MLAFLKKRRNKTFYVTLVSQILIAAQLILAIFGYDHVLTVVLQNKILAAVDALLVVLSTLGLLNDPTTPGLNDKK